MLGMVGQAQTKDNVWGMQGLIAKLCGTWRGIWLMPAL